jgi:hypothetical protein
MAQPAQPEVTLGSPHQACAMITEMNDQFGKGSLSINADLARKNIMLIE